MEMGKKKLWATLGLQRVAVLPYNPYFEQRIIGIRKKYGISETARGYHFIDPSLEKYTGVDPANVTESWLSVGEHPDIEITLPSESSGIKGQLPSDINQLLADFGLPSALFNSIFYYLFTGESEVFTWMEYDLGAQVSFENRTNNLGKSTIDELDWIDEYGETLTVKVQLNRWSSKKLWEKIWDEDIEEKLLKLRGNERPARLPSLSLSTSEWVCEGLGKVKRR